MNPKIATLLEVIFRSCNGKIYQSFFVPEPAILDLYLLSLCLFSLKQELVSFYPERPIFSLPIYKESFLQG